MRSRIKVAFDDLENGWAGIQIISPDDRFEITASYSPSDSFLDLTTSLRRLFSSNVDTKVTWHCEPLEYEMLFSRTDLEILLEILEFTDHRRMKEERNTVFSISGSYEDICLPFWRALRDLQGRFSREELDDRWHRRFPSKEIDMLTKEIRQETT